MRLDKSDEGNLSGKQLLPERVRASVKILLAGLVALRPPPPFAPRSSHTWDTYRVMRVVAVTSINQATTDFPTVVSRPVLGR